MQKGHEVAPVCPNCESTNVLIQEWGRGCIIRKPNNSECKIVSWETCGYHYECEECDYRWDNAE